MTALPATAQDDGAEAPTSMVIWNLPPKDSPAYKYLRDIAGVVGGEELARSNAEMWLLEPFRAEMLRHAGGEQGVQMIELGKSYNELMAGVANRVESSEMPADPGPYAAYMQQMMKSPSVTAVTIMMVKPPAMMEYALARGQQESIGTWAAPESMRDEIVIQINQTEKITVKRNRVETLADRTIWHGTIAGSQMPVSLIWWPGGKLTASFSYRNKMYAIRNLKGMAHAVIEMDPDDLPPEHPEAEMSMRGGMRPEMSSKPGMEPGLRGVHARTMPRIQAPKQPLKPAPVKPKNPMKSEEDQRNLEDARETAQSMPPEFLALLEHKPSMLTPGLNSTTPVVITVLFVYSKAVASLYENIDNDLIALAVQQSNESFRLSKIGNVRLEVAGTYQSDYEEGDANLYNHLWRLADKGDGYLDEIHKIRDDKKADVVVMLVTSNSGCGLATRVGAYEDEAFAVVNHQCATATFSVAHEIGHLIGARHDRSLDNSTQPFPYGHGYVNQEKWRTMMAYKSACNGCPRLPIWSNPDVVVAEEPAGDAMTNNARVIADQAARVAAFR